LNVGKVLLFSKTNTGPRRKTCGAGIEVTQKLHEETGNAVSNLCWQFVQLHNMAYCVRKLQMFMK